MTNHVKSDLNLASSPLKNRRLFFLLFSLGAAAFVAVSVLGGSIYLRYRSESSSIQKTIREMNIRTNEEQREERQFSTRIEEIQKVLTLDVEFLNNLIFQKSFSWMNFFAALEESLPESSYIVSLSPYPAVESAMEVRFMAAFANLNDLLRFMTRLDAKGFQNIHIISESRTEEGFLLSEISVRYVHNV